MKTRELKVMAAVLLAMGLTGCQQEENEVVINEHPTVERVTFLPQLQTRASETAFEQNDEIGIFAVARGYQLDYGKNNYAENVRYRYNGTQFEAVNDNEAIIPAEDGLAYHAVYPFSAGIGPAYTFSVKADQTTHAAKTASDLCTAYESVTTNKRVHLTFSHRLSHVVVQLEGSNLASKQVSVTLKDVLTQVSTDLGTGKFEGTGTPADVKLGATKTNIYEAIIAPQTIAAGQKFIVVTVNGKEVNFSQGTPIVLGSGKEATYIIDTDNEVVVGGDINPWNQEGPVTQLGNVTFSDPGLKFYVTACERIGRSIVVDFEVKNVSGRNLTDLRIHEAPFGGWMDAILYNNRIRDDVGGEYWNGIGMCFGVPMRNFNYEATCPMLTAGETMKGRIMLQGGFDNSNSAKHITIHRAVSCGNMKLADGLNIGDGFGILRMDNIPITDNRVMTGGAQTPYRQLDVKMTGCTIVNTWGDCELSFSITNNTGELLKDFRLSMNGYMYEEGTVLRDDQDNNYLNGYIWRTIDDHEEEITHCDMMLNGSDWGSYHTLDLPAGKTITGKVVARDVSKTAKSITCTMECNTPTMVFEDPYVRFYNIPVNR